MSWYPAEVDAGIISDLVIANASLESLNETLILSPSTVVEAQSIVDNTTVCVDINVALEIIGSADFNANTNRNSFTNIVGSAANSSAVSMNMIAVIIRIVDDYPRTRRAGVRFRRTISKNVPSIAGQTLKVGRNHLPGRGFLQWGARRAADVRSVGKFV